MKTKSIVPHLAQLPFMPFILAAMLALVAVGCKTGNLAQYSENSFTPAPPKDARDVVLREADVVKISFPETANLDTVQAIRRDGKITLPMVGEVTAAGKTPVQLQNELVGLYTNQLVSANQITVTVQSASFPVFVTGAVNRPGKLVSDHPLTVLEAIMESGGFDFTRAKLNKVKIIRTMDNKQTKTLTANLRGLINGSPIDVLYLQPSDIVYVPSKIVWF